MSSLKSSQCPLCGGSGKVPRLQWRTLVLIPRYRAEPVVLCRDCNGSGQITGRVEKVLIFFTDGSTWRTSIPVRVAKGMLTIIREGHITLCVRGEVDDEGLTHYHEISEV